MSASVDSVSLAEAAVRLSATIQNLSSSTLYVRRTDSASPSDHDYVVEAGESLILDAAPYYPLEGAWDAADGTALVTEVFESADSVWQVGGTPTRVSFGELADVAQFENSLFRDYPQSPGLAVAGGLGEPFVGGTGWAAYVEELGELCEAWVEVGRLPSTGDLSMGLLDNNYGPANPELEGEVTAAYISIQPDGHVDINPQVGSTTTLPAGTIQVGDRAGLAQVATGVVRFWRIRDGVFEALADIDPGLYRKSGWVWFGGRNDLDTVYAGIAAFGCGNVYPP